MKTPQIPALDGFTPLGFTPTPTIFLFVKDGSWVADHTEAGAYGEAVLDLFETYEIPTPFGDGTPGDIVAATLRRHHPDHHVVIENRAQRRITEGLRSGQIDPDFG